MKFADVTPHLVVSDIDRSLAFYRDVLRLLRRHHPDGYVVTFAQPNR